jgi:hypothetical protein
MRARLAMVVLCALLLGPALPGRRPAHAAATGVPVTVVQIAGGRAYLEPGAQAGLAPGAEVELRGRRFKVLAVTATHAAIDPADARLAEGDRGVALVTAAAAAPAAPLPAPEPLSRWAGQWRDPTWPSERQTPKPAPLGPMAPPGALHLVLVGQAIADLPDSGPASGHLALEARGSWEPWADKPFGVDADAAALLWLQDELGPVAGVQQALRVAELRLRYGSGADPFLALGRMRWAARTVGLLDGVRVRSPARHGFSVAAFGGFVPDVVTGRPATDASRFGAEVTWAAPAAAAQPRASLTAYASSFGGSLDERRVTALFDAAPGPFLVAGRAELSLFDADNPWGASTLELTGAGADASYRAGGWHSGAHLDLRQPERSRYLASLLPQGWQCTAQPQAPGVPEPCDGDRNYRLWGAADAGWQSSTLAISAGVAAIVDRGDVAERSAFADVRALRVLGRGHVGLGVLGVHGTFLDQMALRLEAGAVLLHDQLDVSVYWRGAQLSYAGAVEDLLENRVGLDAALALGPRLDLVVTLEGTTGSDMSGLVGLATCVWRPLP